MAHVIVSDELTEFAAKVPEKAAEKPVFNGDSLFRQMIGIRTAAASHAALVHKMEQLLTAADSGLTAYKQAAHTVDANYTGTDALNKTELTQLNEVSREVFRPLNANSEVAGAQDAVEPGMPTPADLAPEKQRSYWWNDYDNLPNTMPGIGAATVPTVPVDLRPWELRVFEPPPALPGPPPPVPEH